jgi:diguanylate cyclase (GGDEF)-like protein/PAS domain S-box-containing protein
MQAQATIEEPSSQYSHPRKIGWLGTTALAMGGSNQSLFIISALFVGQGDIAGQGSAAVPLLLLGLILALAAAPGWLELVLISPNRVGGISAACVEAFKPYSQILSALSSICYWWGWIPTCGLTAILSASAIHQWYLPNVPVWLMACSLVTMFTIINLLGIKWVTRFAIPIATLSALLAFLSAFIPLSTGSVNWTQAFDFKLTLPFAGWFGELTSLMAGLYLIGFAAPAFEAALCHVGETKDPVKNLPKALWASAVMATLYFAVVPIIWYGTIGSEAMGRDLALELGPTFAPIFGSLAKSMAIWFIMFNMFHGTLQPLAGAARTLSQLSDDGLAPRFLAKRLANDVPWVATVVTAGFAIVFLLIGDPIWLIAAANFTYLIGICLPSVAVWLLRRDQPNVLRPYRAPQGFITLGLLAALAWMASTILGFEQFGLPTVVIGLAMAYSGAFVFAWRKFEDRRLQGLSGFAPTLHSQLTGSMLLVLLLDGAGYIVAVSQMQNGEGALVTFLSDIFVIVAMLTVSVGIVLPGMIAHTAELISAASSKLAHGVLKDFATAVMSLGKGNIEKSFEMAGIVPIHIQRRDELGAMATNFNLMQNEIAYAAIGLEDTRLSLKKTQSTLLDVNRELATQVTEQQQLAQELAVVATAFESQEGLIITNESHEILRVNQAYTNITGFRLHEVLGKLPNFNCLDLHGEHFFKNIWTQLYSYRLWRGEIMNRRKNGEIYPERLSISAVVDAQNHIVNYVYSCSDDTEAKKSVAEIHMLAFYDSLTKLPNRRLLNDKLNEAISAGAYHDEYCAALFLDLDHFKMLNDTQGHTMGDNLLIEVAKRLISVVIDPSRVARLGGDEFVILLENLSANSVLAAKQAEALAQKVSIAINKPFDLANSRFNISPSIGICLFQSNALSADEVLKRADSAMYLAKNAGRNSIRFYDPAMQSELEARLQLGNWMHSALEQNQFVLMYQLQVDYDNNPLGAEVLLRWQHPEQGMIFPDKFIPLAEENGMIVPIGLWVLETACKQLKAWEIDTTMSRLQLSVNVSARQFDELDFVEKIKKIIANTAINPNRLKLEITESLVMTDTVEVISKIQRIKELGVSFAMDDFGTGHSSLAYLSRLPIDQIKIDQSFVRNLNIKSSAVIVRTIIGMGTNLGLSVIAEGVETAEQREFLYQNGCEAYQGYYFSKPIPLDAFTALLKKSYSTIPS